MTSRQNLIGYSAGGLAACGAVTFTNPLEVIKTRLQLQGELASRNSKGTIRPYANTLQGMMVIVRNDGFLGLQKGLGTAYIYQVAMNGTRLGSYEPFKRTLTRIFGYQPNQHVGWINVVAGSSAGVLGASIGSPFFLVKTRMQSFTSSAAAVGHQHQYEGILAALKSVYREGGLKNGLFRGVTASMARTGVGSGVQLSTYDQVKRKISKTGYIREGRWTYFTSSMITGLFVCVAMNPFDVVTTRMYNQKSAADGGGKGVLYTSTSDCFVKIIRTEGIHGLFKGLGAHYLRIG